MLGLPLLLILVFGLGMGALARSEWAMRWLIERGVAASQGRLVVEGVSGSLGQGLQAQRIRWSDPSRQIEAGPITLQLSWRSLWGPVWHVDALAIGTLRWQGSAATKAAPWPDDLRPPRDLVIEHIAIEWLEVVLPEPALEIDARSIEAQLLHAQQAWQFKLLSLAGLKTRAGSKPVATAPDSASASASASARVTPWSVWVGPQGWIDAPQMQAKLASLAPLTIEAQVQALPGRADAPWALVQDRLGLSAQTRLHFQVSGRLEKPDWQLDLPGDRIQARIEGSALQSGRMKLSNAAPGLLSAGLLPLTRLEGQWRLEGPRLWFDAVRLEGPAGSAQVQGWWRLDADGFGRTASASDTSPAARAADWLELELASPALNLAGLSKGFQRTALQTQLHLRGSPARWHVFAEGRDPDRAVSMRAQLAFHGRRMQIDRILLEGPEGRAQIAGEIDLASLAKAGALQGPQSVQTLQNGNVHLHGRFDRLNLGRWIEQIPAWPVTGPFALTLRPGEPVLAEARLQWGPARLAIQAGPGAATALQVRLEGLPAGELWPGARGLLQADLRLTGRWPRMTAALRAQAREAALNLQGASLSAQSASLDLSVQDLESALQQGRGLAPDRATDFTIALNASRLAWKEVRLNSLQTAFEGRSADRQTQEGRLLRLELAADKDRLALSSPVALWRHSSALRLSPSVWQISSSRAASAELVMAQLEWGEQGAQVQARIDALSMAGLAAWLEPWLAKGILDGTLDALGPQALLMRARLSLQLPGSLLWNEAQGSLALTRLAGDLRIPSDGKGQTIPMGLTQASLTAQLKGGDLALQWILEGRLLGRIQGEASALAVLSDAGLHREAALQGRLQAELPSLAVARVFTGEAWQIDGALQAELTLGGTLNAPSWSGAISGRDLMALEQALGMRLDRGVLRASLVDNRIDIEQLSFRSSQGRVLMSGVLRSDERSEARILLERLPIPLGPGQRLVLSGEAQARLGRDGLILTGQLRADEGVIEISSASTPSLAPDIRVRSAGTPSGLRPTNAGLTGTASGGAADRAGSAPAERGGAPRGLRVQSDLQIDLGEQLRVHGAGLETRLVGQLRLSGQLPDGVRVEGSVQTRAGVWRGFGQDLQIERGTLVFTGALEDPAIDVVAWRRYQPVEAGVELSGTARRPLLTLVSRPEVPDPDKLSWLVLGTAFDTTRGGQNAALQAAAAVLVAGTDAASPIRNLASNFGLDLLTLRTAPAGASDAGAAGSFAQDSIVTLGKRLTERLFLSYEQSLRGLQNLFRLQYQINERLNVRARAGSQTGVDLIWSRRYD